MKLIAPVSLGSSGQMIVLCGTLVYCCSVLMNGRATARLSASRAVRQDWRTTPRGSGPFGSWSSAAVLALWFSHAVQNR